MKNKILPLIILLLALMTFSACVGDPPAIKNRYTVVFWCDGEVLLRYDVEEGQPITRFPDNLNSAGYDYEYGEYPETVLKNTTVQVKRIPKSYNVTFDYNGATIAPDEYIFSFKYNSLMTDMPTPSRDGYIFLGFLYADKLYNKNSVYDLTGNVKMVAQWQSQFEYEECSGGIYLNSYIGDNVTDYLYVPDYIDNQRVVGIAKGIFKDVKMNSLSFPFFDEKENDISTAYIGFYFDLDITEHENLPSALKDITIRNGFTIGSHAFIDCKNISFIRIPDSITSIGDRAFYGCSSLKNINLRGVSQIGSEAFMNCSDSGFSLLIMSSIYEIGSDAFRNCTSLTTVTIGNSIGRIGDHAFYNCTSLKTVTINTSIPCDLGEKVFYYGEDEENSSIINMEIHVASDGDSYTENEDWGVYKDIIIDDSKSDESTEGGEVM